MRSKLFSCAVILTLIGTLNLTTGCAWWKRHFGPKTSQQPGAPPALPEGGGIAGAERPLISGELRHGEFAPIYFDYDSAKVRPSEMSRLETVAAALKGNSKKLVIEGHCDERGTAEYNRALGERRAQAAREELIHLGIASSRITTISYGKDRPVEPSHDDTAWSRNRRAEFVIATQ